MPSEKMDNRADEPTVILPVVPLRDMVIFPHTVLPFVVGRKRSLNALTLAMDGNKRVFLVPQKTSDMDEPDGSQVDPVGTIGEVLQQVLLPDGNMQIMVKGESRARILQIIPASDCLKVEVEPLHEPKTAPAEGVALGRSVVESFKAYAGLNKSIAEALVQQVSAILDPSQLADVVAAQIPFKLEDHKRLLNMIAPAERLRLLLKLMEMEMEIHRIEQQVESHAKKEMERHQKEYFLKEKIRAIQKEMGTSDEEGDELAELEVEIEAKNMSPEAREKIEQEFRKLKKMSPMSPEATIIRNYIEWNLSLPWYERSEVKNDLSHAEDILNQEHYGLLKPKERILEYLAVQSLVNKVQGPVLCFVGPPGVGKTSLAKSVAEATGRKYIRLSLGGVRDEAEIRGHRRTYIGAMPGKIIQSLKKAGVNNPVFCLDEVDKMSMDFRGDPSAALLEVLDPEQNSAFNDHYLDMDYDLSDILFITTANTLPDIPLPLQDRMEVIRLTGYTEQEKYHIARDFLIPRQIEMNGLGNRDVRFSKNGVTTIIQKYTREAGVRNLNREIASVCSKIARQVVSREKTSRFNVTARSVPKYLGKPRFERGKVEAEDQIGLATGLAWTQVGGELLGVETAIVPGNGKLTVTGKLGDVMKESAEAAVTYVRSRSDSLNIDDDFYKKLDLHIHIPEGAIPKDGPSAGITMCTSIVSSLTKRPVRRDVAMTGEITLRGRVLPIGGLKEKMLAAHSGGIKKIIIPKDNQKDLTEIPHDILKLMVVVPVEHMDEVLEQALIHAYPIDTGYIHAV